MKFLVILGLLFLPLLSSNAQNADVDKKYFISRWESSTQGEDIAFDILTDSTLTMYPDNNTLPDGVKMNYSLELSEYPYTIIMVNEDNPLFHLQSIIVKIEVIDQNNIKFTAVKATLAGGEEKIPDEDSSTLTLRRYIDSDKGKGKVNPD